MVSATLTGSIKWESQIVLLFMKSWNDRLFLSKGRITKMLNAHTSIFQSTVWILYPKASPIEKINLSAALLSRFNLMFFSLDKPNRTTTGLLSMSLMYTCTMLSQSWAWVHWSSPYVSLLAPVHAHHPTSSKCMFVCTKYKKPKEVEVRFSARDKLCCWRPLCLLARLKWTCDAWVGSCWPTIFCMSHAVWTKIQHVCAHQTKHCFCSSNSWPPLADWALVCHSPRALSMESIVSSWASYGTHTWSTPWDSLRCSSQWMHCGLTLWTWWYTSECPAPFPTPDLGSLWIGPIQCSEAAAWVGLWGLMCHGRSSLVWTSSLLGIPF